MLIATIQMTGLPLLIVCPGHPTDEPNFVSQAAETFFTI
jgi:hypothetical protein